MPARPLAGVRGMTTDLRMSAVDGGMRDADRKTTNVSSAQ